MTHGAVPNARVSIVVLTYNRSDALLVVLSALALQCTADDEVVIADDGSNPEQVAGMSAGLARIRPLFACPVRHVWHPDCGFTASRARNLGAVASRGEYLIFLDGDCVPHPHFLAQHRLLMAQGAFVNGSRVLLSPALTQQVLASAVSLQQQTLWDWLRYRLQGHANKWLWLLGVRYVPAAWLAGKRIVSRFVWKGIRSCNLGVWRKDFEAVNGFDEVFAGWGHEDADLVLRLHHAGVVRKNGFWATEVWHLHHPENTRLNAQANHARVVARMATHRVVAEQGVRQLIEDKNIEINDLSTN
jgi:glycosyltransferase involved in cell wall biosynthesis